MDATERALQDQALAHGLVGYLPEPSECMPADVEASIREAAERDEAQLHSIAGLRGPADPESSGSFEIGARAAAWRTAAPDAVAPEPVDLAAFAGAAALEDIGLDALKAELTRRGAKAGGSLEERARRLWRFATLPPGAEVPRDLRPKPPKKPRAEKPAREKRKLGPAAPARPKRKSPRHVADTSRAPLIAAAKLSRKERDILDFCGSVPSGRR